MENFNPFVANKDCPQYVSWKHVKNGTVCDLELILPFKAILIEYNGTNKYMCICAAVCKTQKLNVSELLKDELMMMDIPIKTFKRAWLCINYTFRSQLSESDNIRITFKKISKQDIEITKYEKMAPTKEHIEFAKKNYKEPEPFKKTLIRKSETL